MIKYSINISGKVSERKDDKMSKNQRSQWYHYGICTLLFFVVLLLSLLGKTLLELDISSLFFVAVAFNSWYGGFVGGLITTVLAVLINDYFFLPPLYSLVLTNVEELQLILFSLIALVIIGLNAQLRKTKQQLEEEIQGLNHELERRVSELQKILDVTPIGLAIAEDPEGRVIRINSYCQKLLNVSPDSNISKTAAGAEALPYKVLHNGKEVPGKELPMQIAAAQGVEIQNWEFELVRTDGAVFNMLGYAVPILDEQGKIRGSIGAFLDITKRQQIEKALRQKQEWINLAQEAAKIGSFEWNIQTNVNTWSKELEALYGLEPGEFGGTYEEWARWIHPDDLVKAQADVVTSLETGEFFTDWRVVWSDGSIHWLHARAKVFYDDAGKPLRMVGINVDVTEQKLAEEALRRSEARLRRIIDSNIIGIFFGGLSGNITDANDAFLHMLGYSWQDLLDGKINWAVLTPPEYVEQNQQAIEELRATGICTPFEKEFLRKDGSRVWIEIGGALFDDDQAVCYVIDITQRKQAEEALRQSEARSRQLIDSNLIGVLFADFEGNILEANDAFLRMVGYTRQELNHVGWRNITPPEHFPSDERAIVEIKTKGVCTPFEKEYLRKDGSRVPILLGSARIMETEKECVCFVLDLSEGKRNENALQESQERLNLALEAANMATWNWNIPTGKIDWFPKLEALLDLTPGSFDGRYETVMAMIHPDDHELVNQAIMNAVYKREEFNIEFRFTRPDGTLRWAVGRGRVFYDPMGNPVQMTGVNLDITERKQIEAERADLLAREQSARQQAETANRMKDDFLAMVSHELRSPLNPILGWSQLLQTQKLNAATIAQAVEIIERNAKLQARLIEDLLDVSRMLRGKVSLNTTTVNLHYVIMAALETVRLPAQAKSIQLQTELDSNIEPVLGDPNRLQQIVWNLLTNAVKFTPEGGQVMIKLQTVGAQHCCAPTCAQIQVSDTGKGINSDFLPYVFERFQQADAATTRKFGGLGLGLAIVRHLVELHGGSVAVESPGEGLGSTFTVMLPLINAVAQTSQEDWLLKSSPNLEGLRIVVVDDDVDTLELLTFILEQYNVEVKAVASAREALEAIIKIQPDLLISDIAMPEMDGYMLISQVRALEGLQKRKLPAIALTAFAGEANQKRIISAGFERHLTKPVEPVQLAEVIADLTRRFSIN